MSISAKYHFKSVFNVGTIGLQRCWQSCVEPRRAGGAFGGADIQAPPRLNIYINSSTGGCEQDRISALLAELQRTEADGRSVREQMRAELRRAEVCNWFNALSVFCLW